MQRVERARQERTAALERIQHLQETGQLVIRQMTPEERARYGPPKNLEPKRKTGRRLPPRERDEAPGNPQPEE